MNALKRRGGDIHVVMNWEKIRKLQLGELGFGGSINYEENANLRTQSKEISLQCKATRSDAELEECGVALRYSDHAPTWCRKYSNACFLTPRDCLNRQFRYMCTLLPRC